MKDIPCEYLLQSTMSCGANDNWTELLDTMRSRASFIAREENA